MNDYDFPIDVTIQLNNVGGPERRHDVRARDHRHAHAGRAQRRRERRRHRARSRPTATVGPIGGIRQKLWGARRRGRRLVPRSGRRTATRSSATFPTGCGCSRSTTLDDSLDVLEAIRDDGDLDALPTCTAELRRPAARTAELTASAQRGLGGIAQNRAPRMETVTTTSAPTPATPSRSRRDHRDLARDHRRARGGVLHLREPLRRLAVVRPAGFQSVLLTQWIAACRDVPRRLPRHGRPGVAGHPARLSAAARLRAAELAARPLPGGRRAASPPGDVGHPDLLRLLRRLRGVGAVGDHVAVVQRRRHRHDRPAVPPRHRLLPVRDAVLQRAARLHLGRAAGLPAGDRARVVPLRIGADRPARAAHLEGRAHPARRDRRPLPARAGREPVARPLQDARRAGRPHHRPRLHRRQRRSSPGRRSSRSSP